MANIPKLLLIEYGASLNNFKKGEQIFNENWLAKFYFQVETGQIKMFNYGENNDYIQGIFGAGESFGEPPLLANNTYPANAVAVTDSKIWVLNKEKYLTLLKSNVEILYELTSLLAKRLYYKTNLLNAINTKEPAKRILTIIDYFKDKSIKNNKEYFEVPFTRQAIADMTGLRVETVIKKVLLLEQKGELIMKEHKIYRKY